jgi:hypothetical protein
LIRGVVKVEMLLKFERAGSTARSRSLSPLWLQGSSSGVSERRPSQQDSTDDSPSTKEISRRSWHEQWKKKRRRRRKRKKKKRRLMIYNSNSVYKEKGHHMTIVNRDSRGCNPHYLSPVYVDCWCFGLRLFEAS